MKIQKSGVFAFQTIAVAPGSDGNVFYDSGCGRGIIRKEFNDKLEAVGRSTLVKPVPIILQGVNGQTSSCDHGALFCTIYAHYAYLITHAWPMIIVKCWETFKTTIICHTKSLGDPKLEKMAQNLIYGYFCTIYAHSFTLHMNRIFFRQTAMHVSSYHCAEPSCKKS